MTVPRNIRNCSVAVVGGAGFLGSHLVKYLIEQRGCKVLVIDNLVSGKSEFIHPDAKFEHADITGSEDYIRSLFFQYATRFVFNYAASPYIPVSFERPLYVFNVNAFGALKVINAAQEAGCDGILQISSAEIYGDAIRPSGSCTRSIDWNGKINEDHPTNPHSTYGASKLAIDSIVQARWREAKTPVIALRQFNCVGEGETHPYVIPEIISQLCHNPTPAIRLGNNSTRDFLYAGDQVIMATELLESGKFGEVYNLGSESSISIYDLAQQISDVVDAGRVTIEQDPVRVRPWEIWHLQSDNTKIYGVVPSRPQVNLRQAIERTVAYYEKNGRKWCWEK